MLSGNGSVLMLSGYCTWTNTDDQFPVSVAKLYPEQCPHYNVGYMCRMSGGGIDNKGYGFLEIHSDGAVDISYVSDSGYLMMETLVWIR